MEEFDYWAEEGFLEGKLSDYPPFLEALQALQQANRRLVSGVPAGLKPKGEEATVDEASKLLMYMISEAVQLNSAQLGVMSRTLFFEIQRLRREVVELRKLVAPPD